MPKNGATSKLPTQINNYCLKNKVHIRDKTNGIAVATLWREKNNGSRIATKVLVDGKKLIVPADPSHTETPFLGSLAITLKLTGDFLKITELDVDGDWTVIYVDIKKLVKEVAYFTYPCVPQELTLDEATRKITNLPQEFKPDVGMYNRHGVALFGIENMTYVLYWAKPHEEQVQKIPCAFIDRERGGGTSVARSKDYFLNFEYIKRTNTPQTYSLNREPAQPIDLKTAIA